ncbi:MAG: M61 family metallopeptidase [Myxococcales bacterium]|nr:M61 family metallopeptidase [Myxococcales bacterium]
MLRPSMLFVAALLWTAAAAHAAPPLHYTMRFPAPETHYAEVEARLPTGGAPRLELMMAVWTPGSYLVREFSRHVEGVTARGPAGALAVNKTAKNRWVVETRGAAEVTVRYRLYGREMSVRTNWIEADFALINGAPSWLVPVGRVSGAGPFDVVFEGPAGWGAPHTALPAHPNGKAGHFRAPDFDTVVDSPVLLGQAEVRRFEVGGKPHVLVLQGGGGLWDADAAADAVRRVVEANAALWGRLPDYDRYVFLQLLTEARGGLEHLDSTVMMASRWAWRVPAERRDWLGLVSHEFFHAWNVKRMRPVELGPFDYETENYTRSLWIAEGLTSYYDDLLVRRAGMMTEGQYLEALSKTIEAVEKTPGRAVRSLEDASFDAWIKHYRPDENSANTTVSYYGGGALVGWLLDARVRAASGHTKTLDDVLRAAWARFGETGYTPQQFAALASSVAGEDLAPWIARRVAAPLETIDYGEALKVFGLRFADQGAGEGKGQDKDKGKGKGKGTDEKGWRGFVLAGRNEVTRVLRDTPAHAAGINVGDELLAAQGYRVPPGGWDARRAQYAPGAQVALLLARRERLRTVQVTLGEAPRRTWRLEPDPDADAAAKARRAAWLKAAGG